MATTNNSAVSAPDVSNEVSPRRTPDHKLLARLVVRECRSFYPSAIEAGYADSVARRGLKALASESKPVAEAIRKESESAHIPIERLKPLAINRLYLEIADVNSANGMKAIEIAGRLRETDWFVRSTDSILPVFLTLGEQSPQPALDVLPEYSDET